MKHVGLEGYFLFIARQLADIGFPRKSMPFFGITNLYTLHVICWKQRKSILGEGRCKARLEAILRTYILLELLVQLVGNFIFVWEKSGILKNE